MTLALSSCPRRLLCYFPHLIASPLPVSQTLTSARHAQAMPTGSGCPHSPGFEHWVKRLGKEQHGPDESWLVQCVVSRDDRVSYVEVKI